MTKKDYEINETRQYVYARDGYKCQYLGCDVCGWDNLVMAHRIAKTKDNIIFVKDYWFWEFNKEIFLIDAKKILNHSLNLVTVCNMYFGRHNDYFNIGNNPEAIKKLLNEIKEDMDGKA